MAVHTFIVYSPYMTDPGMPERRQSVFDAHRERAKEFFAQGILHSGGPLLTPESIASETAEKKAVGSLMVYKGESLAAVKQIVESDVYWTEKVWDREKLVLLPWHVLLPQQPNI